MCPLKITYCVEKEIFSQETILIFEAIYGLAQIKTFSLEYVNITHTQDRNSCHQMMPLNERKRKVF